MNINKTIKESFLGIGQRVKDYIAYERIKTRERARGKDRYEKYNYVKFNRLEMDYNEINMEVLRKLHIILDELREKIEEGNFVLTKIENVNIKEGKCFADMNISIDGYTTRIIDDIVFKKVPWFSIRAYEITPLMYRKLDRILPDIYKQVEELEKMSNEYSIQILMKNLRIENGLVKIENVKILED